MLLQNWVIMLRLIGSTEIVPPVLLKLSVIVIFHDMQREAARTLYSLGTAYQRGIAEGDFEVIAIDNGSSQPLDPEFVTGFGQNFRYEYFATRSSSPVAAINRGAALARGSHIAVVIDGARMASPGLIRATLDAISQAGSPFICALGWHLGPDIQRISMMQGYDQGVEDQLLESIGWRNHGYRLFEISSLASSSHMGLGGGLPVESSWSAVSREIFQDIGGYDERFQTPGGGLASHDYQERILSLPDVEPFVLLGEGTFHQVHGGIATNAKPDALPFDKFNAEYHAIRGKAFSPKRDVVPTYFGAIPAEAAHFAYQPAHWQSRLFGRVKAIIKKLVGRR